MQNELIVKYIYEYKQIGVISSRETIKAIVNKEQMKWFPTFKQLLSKGIWSTQVAKALGIPEMIECKDGATATVLLRYMYKEYNKKRDKVVDKMDDYLFYYDEKCCRLYLNTSLISQHNHPLDII